MALNRLRILVREKISAEYEESIHKKSSPWRGSICAANDSIDSVFDYPASLVSSRVTISPRFADKVEFMPE